MMAPLGCWVLPPLLAALAGLPAVVHAPVAAPLLAAEVVWLAVLVQVAALPVAKVLVGPPATAVLGEVVPLVGPVL